MSDAVAYPMKAFRCPNGLSYWNSPLSGGETQFIYREIFEDRCYEKFGVSIADGDVVFDVGANVGMFARSLLDRFRNVTLYCFEPVPPTRACLQQNIAASPNHASPKVTIFDVALGSSESEMPIVFFPIAPGNSTMYPEDKQLEMNQVADEIRISDLWKSRKGSAILAILLYPIHRWVLRKILQNIYSKQERVMCQVRMLSNVIREKGVEQIDLLKVDVEGAELEVLSGIEDAHWPLIKQIAMEVSPANKPRLQTLSNRLRSLGFTRVAVENAIGGGDDPEVGGPCMLYAVREA